MPLFEWQPGTAALNAGGGAAVSSVSYATAGNCTAAGFYTGSGDGAFVVAQANGTWDTAQEVPGMASLAPYGGKAGGHTNAVFSPPRPA